MTSQAIGQAGIASWAMIPSISRIAAGTAGRGGGFGAAGFAS